MTPCGLAVRPNKPLSHASKYPRPDSNRETRFLRPLAMPFAYEGKAETVGLDPTPGFNLTGFRDRGDAFTLYVSKCR